MNLRHNRISENLLFVLLIASVAGWITAAMAADLQTASSTAPCFAVDAAIHRS